MVLLCVPVSPLGRFKIPLKILSNWSLQHLGHTGEWKILLPSFFFFFNRGGSESWLAFASSPWNCNYRWIIGMIQIPEGLDCATHVLGQLSACFLLLFICLFCFCTLHSAFSAWLYSRKLFNPAQASWSPTIYYKVLGSGGNTSGDNVVPAVKNQLRRRVSQHK